MAEKKSTTGKATPKKRVAKKVEEPKPVSEVQPAIEQDKPREINWDVIGFSSAAVTLLGAAIFYLIGWSYEVNWHAFFGISMTQVSIPPQQVIIQSISSFVTIVLSFSVTLGSYILLLLFRKRLNKNDTKKAEFNIETYLFFSILFS